MKSPLSVTALVGFAEWALNLVRLTDTAGYYIDSTGKKDVGWCLGGWGLPPLRGHPHTAKVGASITPDFWDKGQNTKNPVKSRLSAVPNFWDKALGQANFWDKNIVLNI